MPPLKGPKTRSLELIVLENASVQMLLCCTCSFVQYPFISLAKNYPMAEPAAALQLLSSVWLRVKPEVHIPIVRRPLLLSLPNVVETPAPQAETWVAHKSYLVH